MVNLIENRHVLFFALVGLVLAACSSPTADVSLSLATQTAPPIAAVTATRVPPTNIPVPSATPAPILMRLTEPGCCTQPTWSADSTQVLYIDRPQPSLPAGLYGVELAPAGSAPQLVTQRLGIYSPDRSHVAYPEDDETYIENVGSGQRWIVDNSGRQVAFAPGSNRIVWSVSESSGAGFDVRATEIFVAGLDGTLIGDPFVIFGGGFSGWIDDEHLLLVGKLERDEGERTLFNFTIADGTLVELGHGERLRSGIPSPNGKWVAYLVLFDQEQPQRNGFWIVSSDGQQRMQLDLFGPVQWRDGDHLLMVPQEPGAPSQRIIEIDATTGQSRQLTDPSSASFVIEGGDWRVAPDGQHIAFVSAEERAIWLLRLP